MNDTIAQGTFNDLDLLFQNNNLKFLYLGNS